ncbi:MAG: CDGSH iron-sulfur domain-containing protein [Sumerlaeia bacterium]
MAAKLTVLPNGSLKVEGEFEVVDSTGKAYESAKKPAVFVCRCGQTNKAPFCDGSHKSCDFNSASEAY